MEQVIKMYDIYRSQVEVCVTGSGFIRINVTNNKGEKGCISMNEDMAKLLVSALNIKLSDEVI